jgi:hypothetical protein
MPTARELLEQADVLMRRNRVDQADDIPVLTDVVPSLEEAPLRASSPAPAAGPAEPQPMSSEAIVPAPGASDVRSLEGEPSAWLDIEDAEPSVIGDAPDSVAIVPPVELRRAADDALLQSAEHEEIELTSPADDGFADEVARAPDSGDNASAEFAASAGLAGEAERAPSGELVEYTEVVVPAVYAAPAEGPAPRPEVPSAAALAASFAATMTDAAMAPVPPSAAEAAWTAEPDSAWEAAPAAPDLAANVPTDLPRLGPDDQAHWDSVAEEIRMQVLQRIDLFTDTGLREQLGERLKPIVDRASADLVSTINQHVGELLRAYVAEAIEREIERWRQDN